MKKILLFVVFVLAAACSGAPDEIIVEGVPPTGTPAPTQAPTLVPTGTATPTGTPAPTVTPLAPTGTATPTGTPAPTPTGTPTATSVVAGGGLPPELAALPVDDAPELWDTNSRSWEYVFRSAVSTPGQPARYQVNLVGAFRDAVILKISVDDMLVAAYLIDVVGARTDISAAFDIGEIPTGDAELNAVLVKRFLNVEDGEILPHLTKAVWLGDLPAGTILEFFVKDDADLAVNRGLALVMFFNTSPQILPGGPQFIVDVNGNPVTP